MSDLKKYVEKRKARDPEFAENYESGYLEFKIGVLLREARKEAGLTQEDVAKKLNTRRSAISRRKTTRRTSDCRLYASMQKRSEESCTFP